ncbi:tyrosyl-DNA phosphodiesterase-domain-containing protein [Mycena polygramma]|nr:tyrosyl-DNA phosphodiesterase-domain-containing protein [Mycena polygramma]
MNTKTGRAVAKGSKSLSKAEPIVVDDSETEDDSEHEKMISLRSNKTGTAGPSARPTHVLNSTRKGHASEPIILDSDDSDVEEANEKKNALASMGRSGTAIASTNSRIASLGKRKEEEAAPSSQNAPLGSLPDRAQMEAERLARRKRVLEDDQTTDPKRQRISARTPIASRMFYDGAFFPTATLHANPRADGREAIGLKDIVGPPTSDLKLAILSSFGLEPDWLAEHFHPSVPVIAVISTGEEGSGPSMSRLFESPNWIQTCPKVGTGGCFHMKYMVLLYNSGRLRVVISTANLLSLDWQHLENCVFIQDVLPHSASNVVGNTETTKKSNGEAKAEESFGTLLETVLKATNVGPALTSVKQKNPEVPLKSLTEISKRWDWSNVTAELVPSIAGKWEGWKKIKTTGHPRLMCAIETLGLVAGKTQNLVVECQGSSIGMYTSQWFNQFYKSASGNPSELKAYIKLSEAKRKKLEYPSGVKVVFPTRATVKSTGGYGSDSLFCTRKKWDGGTFPTEAFHDSKSRAGPVLMHTKMIIGSFTQKNNATSAPSDTAGWMYVGSHNFTAPAWGNLSGSADAPVLNVNNYELGVVVPLMTVEDVNTASAWERPSKKYTDDDLPWIQAEN